MAVSTAVACPSPLVSTVVDSKRPTPAWPATNENATGTSGRRARSPAESYSCASMRNVSTSLAVIVSRVEASTTVLSCGFSKATTMRPAIGSLAGCAR